MNDLDKALADIETIRQQMARTVTFRGFGPEILAMTSVGAILAGLFQNAVVGLSGPVIYVCYWLIVAGLCALLIATETMRRAKAVHANLANGMLWGRFWQFLPPLLTGLILSIVLVQSAPEAIWLLPGLWQILVALAVFAAADALPTGMRFVGAWYLLSGFVCIAIAVPGIPGPWVMAIPFALGQGLGALVLKLAEGEPHHV